MNKKGAIVLGTGGDNSNGAQGKFYEGERRLRSHICRAVPTALTNFRFPTPRPSGIMVTGVTTDATDDAIQANIVAVGYRLAA